MAEIIEDYDAQIRKKIEYSNNDVVIEAIKGVEMVTLKPDTRGYKGKPGSTIPKVTLDSTAVTLDETTYIVSEPVVFDAAAKLTLTADGDGQVVVSGTAKGKKAEAVYTQK